MKNKLLISLACGTIITGIVLAIALPLTLCNNKDKDDRDFSKGVKIADIKKGDNLSNYFLVLEFSNRWETPTQDFSQFYFLSPVSGNYGLYYESEASLSDALYIKDEDGIQPVAGWNYASGEDIWNFNPGFPSIVYTIPLENDNYVVDSIDWNGLDKVEGNSFYSWISQQYIYSIDPR